MATGWRSGGGTDDVRGGYVTHVTDETHETNVAFLTERSRPSRESQGKRRRGTSSEVVVQRDDGQTPSVVLGPSGVPAVRRPSSLSLGDEAARNGDARSTGVRVLVPRTEDNVDKSEVCLTSQAVHSTQREVSDKRSNAGKVWADNSTAYPDELKTASRRINLLEGKGLDHEELCAALAVYARIPDLSGQPHHAIGFTEYVARTFIARLRDEHQLPAQLAVKSVATERDVATPDRSLHRLDVAAVLAQMRAG